MSCGADGPLGRPAYAPPTPGSGSSGRGGMRWRGQERRGEAAGSCFATVMAGEDAGSGFEFGSRFDYMPGGARGFGVN